MSGQVVNPRLLALSAMLSAFYLLVVHSNSPDETASTTISVLPRISEVEPGLVLVDSPAPIRLTIDGPPDRLARLEQDSSNVITIGPVSERDTAWRLTADDFNLPEGVDIVTYTPRQVDVPVQREIEVVVEVDPVVVGRPANGYELGAASVSPAEVRVRGPESFLESLSRMETNPVVVDGATMTIRQEVTLNNLRAFVEVVDPEPIVVTVSVTSNTELVEVQAPLVFTSPDADRCTSATRTLSVRFEGPVSTIETLDQSSILATVDCRTLAALGEGRHRADPEIIGHPTDLTEVWRSLDAVIVDVSPPLPRMPEPSEESSGSGTSLQ